MEPDKEQGKGCGQRSGQRLGGTVCGTAAAGRLCLRKGHGMAAGI